MSVRESSERVSLYIKTMQFFRNERASACAQIFAGYTQRVCALFVVVVVAARELKICANPLKRRFVYMLNICECSPVLSERVCVVSLSSYSQLSLAQQHNRTNIYSHPTRGLARSHVAAFVNVFVNIYTSSIHSSICCTTRTIERECAQHTQKASVFCARKVAARAHKTQLGNKIERERPFYKLRQAYAVCFAYDAHEQVSCTQHAPHECGPPTQHAMSPKTLYDQHEMRARGHRLFLGGQIKTAYGWHNTQRHKKNNTH